MGNHIKLETWIKLIVHKNYFEQGRSLIQYFEYLIAFFGLTTQNLEQTMTLAVIFAFCCYLVGWGCYHSDYMRAQTEIGNRYNLFVAEMRAQLKKKH